MVGCDPYDAQILKHLKEHRNILRLLVILVVLLLIARACDYRPAAAEEIPLRRVPGPFHAVQAAVADCGTLPVESRPFQRYVWVPPWADEDWQHVVSFAVNSAVSRSDTIQLPATSPAGTLLRWDLRRLAPKAEELAELIRLWDSLATEEPYFHITEVVASNRRAVTVAGPGGHVGLEQAVLLSGMTQSVNPIVRADWLVVRTLSTLEGGRYYEFLGVQRKPEGRTAQARFLASFGAFEEITEQLRADQRVAVFRSGVTGKPRRVDIFRGLGGRDSIGLITITRDIFDEDRDPKQHPIRNLLAFQDRAREVITMRNNGLLAYALFDAAGNLQDEGPPNVAVDHTVPAPHTTRLQPAISCIRCHGPHDGYQPLRNDVKIMLQRHLDVFDDLSQARASIPENLDRLAGLYAGEPESLVQISRDFYERAVMRATRGTLTAPAVAESVSTIFGGYRYAEVTPETALYELGYTIEGDGHDPAKALRSILPPLPIAADGISPEDPVIGALRLGLPVNRAEFEQVYADAALRVSLAQKDLQKDGEQ